MSKDILVVDDDDTLRNVTALQLKRLGFSSMTASNGQEALSLLAKTVFKLILMDVQMPLMDGLESAQAIRQLEHLGNLVRMPIIAMTANPDRERCFHAGMDDFIFKPVLLRDLKEILAKWMSPEAKHSS